MIGVLRGERKCASTERENQCSHKNAENLLTQQEERECVLVSTEKIKTLKKNAENLLTNPNPYDIIRM
jgi:hypothetical protein